MNADEVNKLTMELQVQFKLLADWNKENIKVEPEQVRKNIETMITFISLL